MLVRLSDDDGFTCGYFDLDVAANKRSQIASDPWARRADPVREASSIGTENDLNEPITYAKSIPIAIYSAGLPDGPVSNRAANGIHPT